MSDFLRDWGIPLLFFGFLGFRFLKGRVVKNQLPELLQKGAIIVDVRSPAEFSTGSAPGSVNIPVSDLPRRMGELDKAKPIVLCCASGMRASTAAAMLKANGFGEVVNAGPWQNACC